MLPHDGYRLPVNFGLLPGGPKKWSSRGEIPRKQASKLLQHNITNSFAKSLWVMVLKKLVVDQPCQERENKCVLVLGVQTLLH